MSGLRATTARLVVAAARTLLREGALLVVVLPFASTSSTDESLTGTPLTKTVAVADEALTE